MKQDEVKKKAENFCKENSITESPVEIVKICKNNGIKVFEEYLPEDVSGLIVVDEEEWPKYNSNKFIIVNLADSAARRRFTIAHELAHFILHKEDSKLYAHRDMPDNGIRKSDDFEQEANYFAANVLMPEELVREKIEVIKDSWGEIPISVLAQAIAASFGVSKSAATIRLRQLGIN